MLGRLTKDPDDRLDYDVDFARWLPAGDVLESVTATITDSTATVDDTEVSNTSAKVWIEGGTIGETATVTVRATTQQGRVKEACFKLSIRNCG